MANVQTDRLTFKHLVTMLLQESRFEFIKCMRLPGFSITLVVFPAMVYIFCGVFFDLGTQQTAASLYWIVSASCIGSLGTALFGFGVYIATERGQGWLLLKRVSPLPIVMLLWSKANMAMLFSALITSLILCLAWTVGSVRLPLFAMLEIIGIMILVTIPFCTLGFVLGCSTSPNSAHAIVNVVYLPMMFLSGILIPYDYFPIWLQQVAHFLPAFHAVQLALSTMDSAAGEPIIYHILVLMGFTVCFLLLGVLVYRQQERDLNV